MTIPEITEAIEGATAVLTDMSVERPDPRLALVIAALGACAESLDRLWERRARNRKSPRHPRAARGSRFSPIKPPI